MCEKKKKKLFLLSVHFFSQRSGQSRHGRQWQVHPDASHGGAPGEFFQSLHRGLDDVWAPPAKNTLNVIETWLILILFPKIFK